MYEVSVREHFDAAHALRGYKGKCESIHGHRFEVTVTLRIEGLDEVGIAYDFSELKKHLRGLLERLDHTSLNDVPPFDRINPSSENIATTIYGELQQRGLPIYSVRVYESPQTCVTYIPDK